MIRSGRYQPVRESLQSLFPGRTRARPALGPEGPVEILDRDLCLRLLNLGAQFCRQFALCLDTLEHLFLFFLEIAQVGQPLPQCAKLLIVQRSGRLFPITGDKGDRVPLIDQSDRRLHLPDLDLQFLRDQLCDLFILLSADNLLRVCCYALFYLY